MFPELHTPRCTLRKIVSSDQQKIFEGLSHPEVIPYYGVSYKTFEATEAQMNFYDDLLKNETGIWWAIELNDSGEFIGACGFNNWSKEHRRIEIGFWLLPQYQGKGYMMEVIPSALDHAFTQKKIHRVEAIVEGGNENSSKLLKKLGFVYEGTHKKCEVKNGKFIDLDFYALLR
jgi:ribosomal-protein-alanine N-acetyltransferase